jgi:hypothetical protein
MGEKRKMEVKYDESLDVLTIDGVKYSGALFREFSFQPDSNRLFRIIKREATDGGDLITVHSYQVEIYAFEAWHNRYQRYRSGM